MMPRERVVVDTSVLLSRLLLAEPVPGRAVGKVVAGGQLLLSEATLTELADVLSRPKFDPYISLKDRQAFIRLLGRIAEMVSVTYPVRACRDPKDDKFLELAVSGQADVIVSGDKDLLRLNPFQGIRLVTPADYLGR